VQKRPLGKTGLHVSELALGTWGLATEAYGTPDEKRFARIVKKALDRDVETFDMAPLWGDGMSEKVIGQTVGPERRDDSIYVTRAGVRWVDGEAQSSFEPATLRRDCEQSLRRLKTDRIDVWLLHNPPDDVLDHEDTRKPLVELVEKLKAEKKIRAWGASVTTAQQGRQAIEAGAEVLCLPYSLLGGDELHDLSGEIEDAKCGVIARSILGYGLLSGRWGESRTFPETDHRRHRWNADALKLRVRQVNRLRFLVHGEVLSMVCAAMRFVLANQQVSTAVLGPRTLGQIDELLGYGKDGAPYLPEYDLTRIPQVLAASEKL
jgi:aryl-alcohol dehydrogenase-like predicted oxidoreductase